VDCTTFKKLGGSWATVRDTDVRVGLEKVHNISLPQQMSVAGVLANGVYLEDALDSLCAGR
jgi:hypothetical protein